MNVHPSEGVNPSGPTTEEPFAANAEYELKIDTDDGAVANIAYRVCFSSREGRRRLQHCAVLKAARPPEQAKAERRSSKGAPDSNVKRGE
jgi:hypothetical protein